MANEPLDRREIGPRWWRYWWLPAHQIWWLSAAAFIDELRVFALVATGVLIICSAALLAACDRHRISLERLVDAQREGLAIDRRLINAYAAETSRYRRAFIYAKRVGEGVPPVQAAIAADRNEKGDPDA